MLGNKGDTLCIRVHPWADSLTDRIVVYETIDEGSTPSWLTYSSVVSMVARLAVNQKDLVRVQEDEQPK